MNLKPTGTGPFYISEVNDKNIVVSFQTEGFNPNYTDKKYISSIILNNNVYKAYIQEITYVFFYGSGCGKEENCSMIEAAAIPEAFATAYLNLFIEGNIKEGDTLLMNAGASGLASVIIPMAKAFGIRVITSVLTEEIADLNRSQPSEMSFFVI